MNSEIKVSVCVVTYNQENYIAECLQSLVDQKTDFKFEIIVGDDCSTDNTKKIVQEFQEKYPYIIKPMFHKKNIGAVDNVLAVYRAAKGKYIAHIDGDDLALPSKLQTQFDTLEDNPSCVICSHDVSLIDSDGVELSKSFKKHKAGVNTILDLYEDLPFFAHSSKMFVNDLNSIYWSEFHSEALDIEIHVQQAKKGNIYHLDQVYGVYRVGVGVSVNEKSLNSLLVNGARRVYDEAIENNLNNKERIKIYYANAMLKCAYQSALYRNKKDLIFFVNESVSIKIFSFTQICMFFLSRVPFVVFFIVKIRSFLKKIKHKHK